MIELVKTNARGVPVGTSHPHVRHDDSVVDQARQLRAGGMTYRAIGAAMGINFVTVWSWLTGRRRKPHVRVIARRRKA